MESSSGASQCPAASAMLRGRRTVEVTSEVSGHDGVALTTGVKASNVCKSGLFDFSRATAVAQTQTASTKPEAGAPKGTVLHLPRVCLQVACRRLSDGSQAASLKGQYPPPSLTFEGTVRWASADPRSSFSVHASIAGKASVTAAQQHGAQRLNRKSNITREGSKNQYYRDLCLQVEERKQLMERERSRNVVDEQKHNDTMQHAVWGRPGSGAPNYHLGTARRTRILHAAEILPQEQKCIGPPMLQVTKTQCSQKGKGQNESFP
ncbi:uncharacterized protein LOC117749785 isoform X1 [Cyclopterus lumpus]|uniref:uncharacterized protein LOC117749785 isoform X1 n=1 Tax=Cyclopterus lumpus TaxID=8103 RepID=UPI0014861C0E|nr:uncharacterized protein LOC117749785 isoform X1 [Cyclopterus lumpus]XP_034416433.1 uncharacterized protein LOC117749785 isoform X1 [Cyclopterus lumpus]